MPFDYVQYQQKVNTLSTEQLQKEWENYTRQIAGGATSTATSVLFSPVTGGVSLIGLGLSAPRIHNARKKREIIEAGLQARGATHNTRKRDVVAPMAVAGAISGLTLGLAGPGAEMIGGEVGAKGVEYVVAHAALDGTGAILEQKHDDHTKKKAEEKLHLQHQNFQKHNTTMIGQQAMPVPQGMYQLPGVSAPPGMVAMALQPGYQLVQDPKLGYVPVPMATSTSPTPVPQYNTMSYQPVSHSQSFGQHTGPSMNSGTPAPQYQQVQQTFQQPFHYSQNPMPQSQNAGYPLGKQGEVYPVQTESQQGFPPSFSEPLPVYSPTNSTPTSGPCQNEKPHSRAMKTPQITVNELPTITQVAPTPESAMEQEIALLKARLLQIELEKRNIAVESTPFSPQATVETLQSQPTSEISSQSSGGGLGCSDHQAYMPSPSPTPQPTQAKQDSSPPLARTSVSPPMRTPPPQYDITLQNQQSNTPVFQQQIPTNQQEQQQQYFQQQTSLPPPAPIQNFPQPQYQQQHTTPHNIPVSQPQPQTQQPYQVQQISIQSMAPKPTPTPPDLGRQDSGYYSQPPSRTQSVSSVPLYNPHQNQNQNLNLSPQPTSLNSPSQHRQIISPNQSIYTPSPSTPTASNLYFPPPPGTTNIPPISPVGKTDYFAAQHQQMGRMNTPQPQMQAPVYRPDVYHPQGGGGQPMVQGGIPVSQHMGQMNGSMQPQYTGQSQMPTNGNGQNQQVNILGTQGWQWGGQQSQFNQPTPMQGQQVQQQQQQQQATITSGYPVR